MCGGHPLSLIDVAFGGDSKSIGVVLGRLYLVSLLLVITLEVALT
jgi:hypothetical protein